MATKEDDPIRDAGHDGEIEAFHSSVLDSLAEHIAVVNERGIIVAVNQAWRRFARSNGAVELAYTSIGKDYLSVCRIGIDAADREQAAAAAEGLRAVLAGEKDEFGLDYACHSPQEQRWFHMRISPLRVPRKGAVISHESTTVRTLLERQLRESQKMEAVGTLAGGIAHDFNNIITSILGNVELARQELAPGHAAHECLDEIRKSGRRAGDLVRQVLSFSRRQVTERKLCALAPVVKEAVSLLRALLTPRLTLEVHCEPDLPMVFVDSSQIMQVLVNLATNAMQAMQHGHGRVRIVVDTVMLEEGLAETFPALRALRSRQPPATVRITVSDDGAGMDATTAARIFEPFFTTRPVDQGTGLGLSVALGIVQSHDGAITVVSEPGKGSTFTVYLPATDTQAGQRDSQPSDATAATPSRGDGLHILYIDDDKALVLLVKRTLERRGYRISGYVDPKAGLAALRADPSSFDLVVSDYNMPGISGLDVAREVRAICTEVPLAIASGFLDEDLRLRALEAGASDLIFKADLAEDMCEAFARLASRNRGA